MIPCNLVCHQEMIFVGFLENIQKNIKKIYLAKLDISDRKKQTLIGLMHILQKLIC